MTLTVEYNEEMLGVTVQGEIDAAYSELDAAKREYRLVDIDAAGTELEKLEQKPIKLLQKD